MRYIENFELREWVKESLRKAIFQKAHALAVQTGCEILVKLQDVSESSKTCYYASDSLERTYSNTGLHKQPGEIAISGETGFPITPMVDRSNQFQNCTCTCDKDTQNNITEERRSETEEVVQESIGANDESIELRTDVAQEVPVPVQLSLLKTTATDSQTDCFSSACESEQNVKREMDKDVTVKVEVIEEEDTGSLQMTSEPIGSDGMETDSVLQQVYEEPAISYPSPVPMSPKPYQCSMCHKAFRSIQVLQKHTQTFHSRAYNIIPRSRGRGYVGVAKQRQHHHSIQMPSTPSEQQRFPCVMCSRNFRHPALLEDHMTRSHMGHSSLLSSTENSFKSSTETKNCPIQLIDSQISECLQNPVDPSGSDQLSASTSSDSTLPKITSVSSLQQFPQSSPLGALTTASKSDPFTQQSPMRPIYRYPGLDPGPGPSSTPQSATQGVSPIRVQREGTRGRVYNTGMMLTTKRDIMSAILLSASPVNSYRAFKRLGPRHLRSVSKQQYTTSARELEQYRVGIIVISQNGGVSFIKKAPSEIRQILEERCTDLCSFWSYSDRFFLPKPKAVQLNNTLQKKLCELGVSGVEY